MMKKKALIIILLLAACLKTFAQIEHPVKWSYAAKRAGKNDAVVFLKATIEPGWHIYSAYQADGGPVKTSFAFSPSGAYNLVGKLAEPEALKKYEKSFEMQVSFFERSVVFQQRIKLECKSVNVRGKLNFMVCNDHKCLPPEDLDFAVTVK